MNERVTQEVAAGGRGMLVSDRVYGAIGGIAILLALFFLVRGGAEDGAAAAPKAVPALVLIEPAVDGAREQPVTLTFEAGGARLAPDGSDAAGKRHLHARIGPSELMPAAGDVRPLEGARYQWTLPRLPAGTHALRLYWSDEMHRPLAEGASDSVVVVVR
jgi:hypothetical protein